MFFRSKMGQTEHKPLKTRHFLRISVRYWGLHLEHIYSENKYKVQNSTLEIKHSNTEVSKSYKYNVDSF